MKTKNIKLDTKYTDHELRNATCHMSNYNSNSAR